MSVILRCALLRASKDVPLAQSPFEALRLITVAAAFSW
jgi:hypothetical protein